MRKLLVLATILVETVAWAGEEPPLSRSGRAAKDVDQRTLSSEQIQRYTAPYLPAVKDCYVTYGRPAKQSTGVLTLQLVVHRNGGVEQLTLDAPGVTGRRLQSLTKCIRTQVVTWRFPVRRDFTTAILPYYFLYRDIPGAGPQLSCWNPRGCPEPAKAALE